MPELSIYDPAAAPSITLTASAVAHIKKMLLAQKCSKGLRLSVKKSGCSGFEYVMDYVNVIKPDDVQVHIDDQLTVFIDPPSLPVLRGLRLDYEKKGLNSVLTFSNPNEKSRCGCGESFAV